ncbi:MAG: radical SAM family heme chaperone HemW [Rickettsiaceae bacterium]|nr:radical SAM family heme chaperone HemW [Rickettsiaceae bacterium]
MTIKKPLAIYVHWPFCLSLCPYCDFNSHLFGQVDEDRWLDAYLKEIEYFRDTIVTSSVISVFFGGGTPSLMNPRTIYSILQKIDSISSILEAEITLEANPTSSEAKKFLDFKNAGINRVSVGVQSLDDQALKFLGRTHSRDKAKKIIEAASAIFQNYSFDLIYARPNQTLLDWERELNEALVFGSNHISMYQLTIEKGTPFYSLHKKGKFELPDHETSADMLSITNEILKIHNFERYEISNFAKAGFESRHNQAYWNYENYLGIGPGAHSRLSSSGAPSLQKVTLEMTDAIMMIHSPTKWLDSVLRNSHGIQTRNRLDLDVVAEEIVMMGLRSRKGISYDHFKSRTGIDLEACLNLKYLQTLIQNEFVYIHQMGAAKFLIPTSKGFDVYSHILPRILKGSFS